MAFTISVNKTRQYMTKCHAPGINACNPGDSLQYQLDCNGSGTSVQCVCAAPDPSACPNIPVEPQEVIVEGDETICEYFATQFDTPELIEEYIKEKGKDENWNNQIMPTFCNKVTDQNCPNNPYPKGDPTNGCSMFTVMGKAGDLCREWAESHICNGTGAQDPTMSDHIMTDYCKNKNDVSWECLCINAGKEGLDPNASIFKDISGSVKANKGCYWKTCQAPNTYLVPSCVRDAKKNGKCPSNVCPEIAKIAKNSGELDRFEQNTSCNLKGGGSQNTSGTDNRNNMDRYRWWIIGGIFVVAILIFAFLALMRKK